MNRDDTNPSISDGVFFQCNFDVLEANTPDHPGVGSVRGGNGVFCLERDLGWGFPLIPLIRWRSGVIFPSCFFFLFSLS